MMLVPHTCVNAAAGSLFKKPLTAFAAGVAGHALLDLIPHKDISAHKAEGLLVLIMLGLVSTSCGLKSPSFWCAVGGVLPDVEHVLPWTDPKRGHRRWFPTHNRRFHSLQVPGADEFRVRLLSQSVVSVTALLFAISRCRPEGCRC
jgi:hypothetical protein